MYLVVYHCQCRYVLNEASKGYYCYSLAQILLRSMEAKHRGHSKQLNEDSHDTSPTSKKHRGRGSIISSIGSILHNIIFPLSLMVLVPSWIMMNWYCVFHLDCSYKTLFFYFLEKGLISGIWNFWQLTPILTPFSLVVVLGYCVWALTLMVLVPGRRAEGPMTPKGNVPVYRDNGFSCYLITMAAFSLLTLVLKQHFGISPSLVYDRFNEILATLNVLALVFCLLLYLKGVYWPSSTDCGASGNPIFDYYWGTELYPRICGVDVKVFTNCRFGMTVWPLLVCIFAIKSHELYGFRESFLVTSLLQMLYITKFFWWEAGYYRTLDIIMDRAGFYLCYGCLAFIPGLFGSMSLYNVIHPVDFGWHYSGSLFLFGLVSFAVNYMADAQKQKVRQTDGRCLVWGRQPEVIRAKYCTEKGEESQSLLLVSGYWGLTRHFHYLPELCLSFAMCASAGFEHLFPFTYVIFIAVLLVHRTFRDDAKCLEKYGSYWEEYCRRVPYKIIPYVF